MRHFDPMTRSAGRCTTPWSLVYLGALREKGAATISRVLIAAASKLCDAIKACLHLSALEQSHLSDFREGGKVEPYEDHSME